VDSGWPISFEDVLRARERIRPHLEPTPLRPYAALDESVGASIRVLVKHENFQPTGAFKVRNALSALTALDPAQRARGVVAATRGNHGLGLAYAGRLLGAPVTVCVPRGNNPEKNEAMRGFGAELVEEGRDYDEAVSVAERLAGERGLRLVHSTNDRDVLAGAATLALEIVEQAPALDAMVISVGGGSQAVGALSVARRLMPTLRVYAVQAERAAASHDSWHARKPVEVPSADTFADGLATRKAYEMTLPALIEGLAGFVTVSESEMAEALRVLLRTTHSLVEGAGAAGLAGLLKLRETLAGKTVGIVLSGANIDRETLARVLTREL
jgi:threonine dehydratase